MSGHRTRRSVRHTLCAGLVVGLVLLGLPVLSPAGSPVVAAAQAADLPATVTTDVLPTVQVNGVVWAQTTVGNTVYATGRFTSARPAGAAAGTNETARGNVLAYDLTTGKLITSFAPSLNGEGLGITASPDGSRIYVVGNFTQATAGGTTATRNRVVALNATTGAFVTSFVPNLDYRARSVVAVGDTVYVGGQFGTANKTARARLAAFKASDGSLLPWNPGADGEVFALVSPGGSRIVAAGRFKNLGGEAHYGMGALDGSTGATLPWAATSVVKNAGADAAIYSLATDGTQVYGTGYQYKSNGGGNLEGSFAADATTGALKWVTGCKGDVYSIQPIGDVVYTVGHAHDCVPIGGWPTTDPLTFQRAVATSSKAGGSNAGGTFAGRPAPTLLNWWPSLEIGTFTGQNQAAWSVTGNSQYISLGGEFPTVEGVAQQGLVRLAVRSIAPRTNGPRYQADFTPQLVPTTTGSLRVNWRTTYDPEDAELTYRVVRDGQTATPVGTVTAASTWWNRPQTGFIDTGLAPGSTHTYRIYAYDRDGNVVVSPSASATLPAATATSAYSQSVLADGAEAYWPLGGARSGNSALDWVGLDDLTLDGSVTTSTSRAIAGDPGSASTFAGTSSSPAAARELQDAPTTFSLETWIRTTTTTGGKIIGFGSAATGASSGADRHVFMRDDGRLTFGVYPGAYKTVTSPSAYNDGQWHHVVAQLSPAGMELYVDGNVVGRDSTTVTSRAAQGYWRVGGDRVAGWPSAPTSTAFAGDIDEVAVYGAPLTAAQIAEHEQLAGVASANQAPTASFAAAPSNLTVAFDGSGSTDPDGAVASYGWNFGDTTTGMGRQVSHTYAAAGTYSVALTVTDDRGATATTTRQVTVTAPGSSAPLAADTFGRTLTGSWGSASPGGAWTLSGGAANFSVGAGTGRVVAAAGANPTAILNSVSNRDNDLAWSVNVDKPATSVGISVTGVGRRIDANNNYRATAKLQADGSVNLSARRVVGGTDTTLRSLVVPGVTVTAGTTLNVRVQVVGNGTTTVRARVWVAGQDEPSTWQVSATDTTPALQRAGGVALTTTLPTGAANAPVTATFDDLVVTPVGG